MFYHMTNITSYDHEIKMQFTTIVIGKHLFVVNHKLGGLQALPWPCQMPCLLILASLVLFCISRTLDLRVLTALLARILAANICLPKINPIPPMVIWTLA